MEKSSQKKRNFLLSALIFFILIFSVSAGAVEFTRPDGTFADTVLAENIKTVQLRQLGIQISYPVIQLGSDKQLLLSFDLMSDALESYQYTIERCNRNWQPTNLMTHQYMEGLPNGYIENYQNSYNTFIRYTHYRLAFPNRDISVKLSGNYIIKVYRNSNPEDVIIVRRFYVVDNQVAITGEIRAAMNPSVRDKAQQLDMIINLAELKVPNVYNDLHIVVKQNNVDLNKVEGLQPQFVRGQELIYERMDQLIFFAGNEYRPLDLRSVRVAGEGVARVKLDSFYRAQAYIDKSRGFHTYTTFQDLNGQRIVAVENTSSAATEADYVQTFFSLEASGAASVYLYGEITNWKIAPEYQLKNNTVSGILECMLFLKQGYINYSYVTVENGRINLLPYEGSFFETENDYLVFVYYRSPELNGDLLVGYRRFNSSI